MRKRFLGLAVAASMAMSLFGMGTASAADASLNVVHGIPGVDVNVCVNGAEAIPDFSYGQVVTGVALPAGSYDVKIVAAADGCDGTAILEAAGVELSDGRNYTAIAYLTEDGSPTLGLYANGTKPVAKGSARVFVRHNAAAPAVDVWANGSPLVTDLENGETAKAVVTKGVYAAWVSLPGDYQPVIGPAVLKLGKGFNYEVYAIGNNTDNYTFAVVATKVGVK
jgi:hypothetical protein